MENEMGKMYRRKIVLVMGGMVVWVVVGIVMGVLFWKGRIGMRVRGIEVERGEGVD